jgi:hypothetical protein
MGKDHPDANLHPEATGLAAKTVQVSVTIYSICTSITLSRHTRLSMT